MIKYPRTPHLEGSRQQSGDEDLDFVPFSEIKGRFLVVEEKIDGANCGISFESGQMLLQSRGHYLTGGDHPQFDLFKAWAFSIRDKLYAVLGNRYIMYGEWLYAKHTVFYDALPHYFLEFDIYDKEEEVFLGTEKRWEMHEGLGIVSVPVLKKAIITSMEEILNLLGQSKFKTRNIFKNFALIAEQTDLTYLPEGLYIKDETSGNVDGRFKWVRADFLQMIKDSGSHWKDRPMVVNMLAPGVDIFA